MAAIRELCAPDYTPEQTAAWTDGRRAEDYIRAMQGGERMWVAEADREIVGFAAWFGDEVRAVYVHPRCVRRGIGTALLEAAEQAAKAAGVEKLQLSSSLTAVPFYLRHGYLQGEACTHRLSGGTDVPCVEMWKVL